MTQMTRIPIVRGGRWLYIHRTDEINGGCILYCVSVSLLTFVAYIRNLHSLIRNQEVKRCLLELKARPLKLKSGPLELKLGPLELKLRFPELNPRSLELNPCPLELKSDPLEREFGPLELKTGSLELKPRPRELKPGPLEIKRGPLELKPRSLELKPRPLKLKLRPSGTQALPSGSQSWPSGTQAWPPGTQAIIHTYKHVSMRAEICVTENGSDHACSSGNMSVRFRDRTPRVRTYVIVVSAVPLLFWLKPSQISLVSTVVRDRGSSVSWVLSAKFSEGVLDKLQ